MEKKNKNGGGGYTVSSICTDRKVYLLTNVFAGDEKAEMVDATKGKEMESDKISRLCKYSLFNRYKLIVTL